LIAVCHGIDDDKLRCVIQAGERRKSSGLLAVDVVGNWLKQGAIYVPRTIEDISSGVHTPPHPSVTPRKFDLR
jgi:hypothetical protein